MSLLISSNGLLDALTREMMMFWLVTTKRALFLPAVRVAFKSSYPYCHESFVHFWDIRSPS